MIITHKPTTHVAEGFLARVDKLADAARSRVAGDSARVREYELAAQEAAAYKEAGYNGPIPPSVLSWAEAKGWAGRQAAESILEASERFYATLYAIRDARLKAKEAIKAAKSYTEIEALFDEFERIIQGA